MEKIIPALIMAMVVSVFSIVIAYMAGSYFAESALRTEFNGRLDQFRADTVTEVTGLRQQLAKTQTENEEVVADLRRELELARSVQEEAAPPKPASKAVKPVNLTPPVSAQQPDAAMVQPPATPVSEETFNRIEKGMSYAEVVRLLGSDGVLTLNLIDENGGVTQQFVWKWITPEGTRGRINLSFLNGYVQNKTSKE